MDLVEITSLIEIKKYMMDMLNNYNIEKGAVKDLQKMLPLIDRMLVEKLLSQDFKQYVHFSDADEAVKRAAENNNIRSGMKPNPGSSVSVSPFGVLTNK